MFDVNKAVFDEKKSYHVMTILGSPFSIKKQRKLLHELGDWHILLWDRKRVDNKELFKQVFGRQQTTVQYSYRNWVWTFTNGKANLWVLSSVRGNTWEYDKTCSKEETLSLLREVRSHILKTLDA